MNLSQDGKTSVNVAKTSVMVEKTSVRVFMQVIIKFQVLSNWYSILIPLPYRLKLWK